MSASWGGPSRVIADVTKVLSDKGVECSIFASSGHRVGIDSIETNHSNVNLFQTDVLSRVWTGHSINLYSAIRQAVDDCDIVHIHELWHYPHYAAYRAAIQSKKPYCVTLHGHLSPWALKNKSFRKTLYMKMVQRRILQKAVALHAMTTEEIQHIRAQGFRGNVTLIPNGVFPEAFENTGTTSDFIRLYPDVADSNIILFLGRIHPVKGLDLLVKSFGDVIKHSPNTYLIIAGPDEDGYLSYLQDILDKNGGGKRCIFTGMLNEQDKLALLNIANVFVLPSYSEGMSISILEAMASKIPVVITEQCHFPDVNRSGSGLVISPKVSDLTESLLYILNNPQIAKSMGTRGYKLVLDKYTWDEIGNKYINLYRGILGYV